MQIIDQNVTGKYICFPKFFHRKKRKEESDIRMVILIKFNTSGINTKPFLVKVATIRRAATRTPTEILKLSSKLRLSHHPHFIFSHFDSFAPEF